MVPLCNSGTKRQKIKPLRPLEYLIKANFCSKFHRNRSTQVSGTLSQTMTLKSAWMKNHQNLEASAAGAEKKKRKKKSIVVTMKITKNNKRKSLK